MTPKADFAFMFVIFFQRLCFLFFIGVHSFHHQVEVDFMSVKFRTVNADEFCLAADFNSASAAHSGAVNHNRIERNNRRNIIFFRNAAAELHHYRRAYRDGEVWFGRSSANFIERFRYERLFAVRAVVGNDNLFIAYGGKIFFENQKVFCPCAEDSYHLIAGVFHSGRNRQERRVAYSATDADNRAEFFNMGRPAKRAEDIFHRVADIALGKFGGTFADSLPDKTNCAFFRIGPGYCQGNSFAVSR